MKEKGRGNSIYRGMEYEAAYFNTFSTLQIVQKSRIYRVWMEGSEGENGKQEPIMEASTKLC